jgi:hypothetical protein
MQNGMIREIREIRVRKKNWRSQNLFNPFNPLLKQNLRKMSKTTLFTFRFCLSALQSS